MQFEHQHNNNVCETLALELENPDATTKISDDGLSKKSKDQKSRKIQTDMLAQCDQSHSGSNHKPVPGFKSVVSNDAPQAS